MYIYKCVVPEMDVLYHKKKDTSKDLLYSVVLLTVVLIGYFVSVHVANAHITDRVHDIVSVDISSDIQCVVNLASNTLPILIAMYSVLWNRKSIYINRLSLMYFLKGVIQFVTVVPGPEYSGSCLNASFFDIMTSGICADMMFSGHTAIVFLLTKSWWRCLVPVEAVLLVLGKQHYISDTIVAVIISSWIEFVVV